MRKLEGLGFLLIGSVLAVSGLMVHGKERSRELYSHEKVGIVAERKVTRINRWFASPLYEVVDMRELDPPLMKTSFFTLGGLVGTPIITHDPNYGRDTEMFNEGNPDYARLR